MAEWYVGKRRDGTYILADARARPSAEVQHAAVHSLCVLCVVEPALRSEGGGLRAKDVGVPMHHGGVHAHAVAVRHDNRPSVGSFEVQAVSGGDARHCESDGWVEPHGFLDAGVQIGELRGGGVGDWPRGWDCDGGDGGAEFGLQAFVGCGMAEEVVEDGSEGYGGGIGAGEAT